MAQPPEPPSEAADSGAANPSARPAPAGSPAVQDERYGPLALLRERKEDGRALILFARADRIGETQESR
jgi:hypothetical protein